MKVKLTPSRIAKLRPRKGEYTVWDASTPHFGVRVKPSGTKRFIHTMHVVGRLRKSTIGDAGRMSLDEARAIALQLDYGSGREEAPPKCPTFAEWVEGIWWPQASPLWKESTRKTSRGRLDRNLLPEFGDKPLNELSKINILPWFEEYSRKSPGGANWALGLLSLILNHAMKASVIERNPAQSIKRNPKHKVTRFLSDEERMCLLAALESLPEHQRVHGQLVKMLLFSGCRSGEIRKLRWEEVGEESLNLSDSKTGAKKVWLGKEAKMILNEERAILGGMKPQSGYVFADPNKGGMCITRGSLIGFWMRLRKRIDLEDLRIHDIRHSFATEAVHQGVPLPVVSKLLGHANIKMTMRYAHARESDIEAGAELIGDHMFDQLKGVRYIG